MTVISGRTLAAKLKDRKHDTMKEKKEKETKKKEREDF